MHRNWMLVVAVSLLWMGWFSNAIPYPPQLGILEGTHLSWFLAYVAASATAIACYFKPDRRHLRALVSIITPLGILRGLSYALGGIWGPIGVHVLVSVFALGYYKARVQSRGFKNRELPEDLPGKW